MSYRIRNIVLITLGAVLAAGLIGASVEATLRARASRTFPVPGRLVDVGGRRLQLDCRGAGAPTVVLESGLDTLGSLSWAAVHDELAASTRVCAYTRAGIAWSDAALAPFDSAAAAGDLHAALATAGEASSPLVLVGHSIGGLYAMAYAERYAADVAGAVLVDSSHPDQVARLEKATGVAVPMPMRLLTFGAAIAWTGVLRLLPLDVAPLNAPTRVRAAADAFLPRSLAALTREARALPATFAALRPASHLGNRPLVVLTAAAPKPAAELAAMDLTAEQGRRREAEWLALQDEEAGWSTNSRHEVIRDASHYIQFDRPDLVVRAVRDVVHAVRSSRRLPQRLSPFVQAARNASP
jgi:pimeloyl-ACP methyl ester carboxylesterase